MSQATPTDTTIAAQAVLPADRDPADVLAEPDAELVALVARFHPIAEMQSRLWWHKSPQPGDMEEPAAWDCREALVGQIASTPSHTTAGWAAKAAVVRWLWEDGNGDGSNALDAMLASIFRDAEHGAGAMAA